MSQILVVPCPRYVRNKNRSEINLGMAFCQSSPSLHQPAVRLTLPGGRDQGTGFFVAPGLVLTCAHVVEAAWPDKAVDVDWAGKTIPGQIEREHYRPKPGPDLALLSWVRRAPGRRRCCWNWPETYWTALRRTRPTRFRSCSPSRPGLSRGAPWQNGWWKS